MIGSFTIAIRKTDPASITHRPMHLMMESDKVGIGPIRFPGQERYRKVCMVGHGLLEIQFLTNDQG